MRARHGLSLLLAVVGCVHQPAPTPVAPASRPVATVVAPASAPVARARPASASAPAPRPQPRTGRETFEELEARLLGGRVSHEPGPPPPEVAQDDAYIRRELRELPLLKHPPAWLTAKLLRRSLGRLPGGTDEAKLQELLDAARQRPDDSLRWAPVDPARGLFVLGYRVDGSHGLVVLDTRGGGRPVRLGPRCGEVYLRDVCGDERPELIVACVLGNEVSAYPTVWEVYALTGAKALSRIARVPKKYSYGAKAEAYCFINRVELPRKGVLELVTVVLDQERCAAERSAAIRVPRRLGERQRYEYRAGAGRFVPRAR